MNNVSIYRSKKRKTVAIQIKPDTSIHISVPYTYTDSVIKRILLEHKDWIIKHQQITKLRNKTAPKPSQLTYLYLGRYYPLVIRQNQLNIIEFSDKFYFSSNSLKYTNLYLTSWYKQQARKVITARVNYYAKMSQTSFKSIAITDAQTQWGSCSSTKNLHFSWKLIMAPLAVLDYVIAHELAHITEMNHSKKFWGIVRKMSPLYREHRTWLRRNGSALHIPDNPKPEN